MHGRLWVLKQDETNELTDAVCRLSAKSPESAFLHRDAT